jgi:hypothetical protein
VGRLHYRCVLGASIPDRPMDLELMLNEFATVFQDWLLVPPLMVGYRMVASVFETQGCNVKLFPVVIPCRPMHATCKHTHGTFDVGAMVQDVCSNHC